MAAEGSSVSLGFGKYAYPHSQSDDMSASAIVAATSSADGLLFLSILTIGAMTFLKYTLPFIKSSNQGEF